jgi:hypothetical protein
MELVVADTVPTEATEVQSHNQNSTFVKLAMKNNDIQLPATSNGELPLCGVVVPPPPKGEGESGRGGGGLAVFFSLLRAAPLSFRLYSSAPEVRAFVDSVVNLALVPGPRRRPFAAAVELLVLNFLRLRWSDPRRLLAVPLSQNVYSHKAVGYRPMRRALAALQALGYAEMVAVGFKDKSTGKGYRSRWQASDALFRDMEKAGIRPMMILSRERVELVKLRPPKLKPNAAKKLRTNGGHSTKLARKPRAPRWPRALGSEKARMEENLRTINAALRSAFIALNVSDADLDAIQDRLHRKYEERRYIDFFDKDLYRVFNDGDPHSGGRFYGGWWQAVPREYRSRIWIAKAGNYPAHSVELDYSEMQPRMVYALEGVPCTNSPYAIYDDLGKDDAARPVIKRVFLIMLNSLSANAARFTAEKSIRKDFEDDWKAHNGRDVKPPYPPIMELLPDGCPPVATIIADIETTRRPIRHRFYDPKIGKRLMYLDSKIAEEVMLRMITESRTIALPIHDSFVVRKGYDIDLKRYMEEAFRAQFPAATEVLTKQSNGALGRWHGDGMGEKKATDKLINMLGAEYLKALADEPPKEPSVYQTLVDEWEATLQRSAPSTFIAPAAIGSDDGEVWS